MGRPDLEVNQIELQDRLSGVGNELHVDVGFGAQAEDDKKEQDDTDEEVPSPLCEEGF